VSPTPVVAEAMRIADETLAPDAQAIDRCELVHRDRFAALAEGGFFGIAGPTELGHFDLAPREARRVIAAIGGGCGATFFCWVQHHGVVRTVRSSSSAALRDELLPELCTGDKFAGVAFAHLRRTDRRAVTARRVAGGWQFDGHAPWATSWGIADVFAIAAESDDGSVVWGLVAGSGSESVHPAPLSLPVFASTGTVALAFDGCIVPDDQIIAVGDLAEWRAADRVRASIGQPAVLGVAERAIRRLGASARGDDDPGSSAARSLTDELAGRWHRDDELLDTMSTGATSDETIGDASTHRAECLDLAQRATTALLAASGGGGLELSHPAQRLAREAMFYVIQAQTGDGRKATLRSAGSRGDG